MGGNQDRRTIVIIHFHLPCSIDPRHPQPVRETGLSRPVRGVEGAPSLGGLEQSQAPVTAAAVAPSASAAEMIAMTDKAAGPVGTVVAERVWSLGRAVLAAAAGFAARTVVE